MYPEDFDPSVSTAGGVSMYGDTCHYQVMYRDADRSFGTPSIWILTNAWTIVWAPGGGSQPIRLTRPGP